MNGNMNGKDLFELLNDLDEDIVEDAWTEREGMVMIFDEPKPPCFWKTAAAAVACIAVVAAGVYGFLKLKPVEVAAPSESDSFYSESSDTESSHTSKIRPNPANIIRSHESAIAEKLDNEDYAVIYVEETNASEDRPIFVSISSFYHTLEGDERRVSETVRVTGPGEYIVHYTRPWGAGTMNALDIEPVGAWDGYPYDPILNGAWIP